MSIQVDDKPALINREEEEEKETIEEAEFRKYIETKLIYGKIKHICIEHTKDDVQDQEQLLSKINNEFKAFVEEDGTQEKM